MSAFKKIFHQWSWVILLSFCIAGLIYPVIGVVALLCMLAPVIVAFFRGRMWCGYFCPRGSFNDLILSKLSQQRNMPELFKKGWFKIGFLIILMSVFAVQLLLVWGDARAIGQVFVRMIIITTLLTIFLGTVYHQRTWCKVCPMGTMAHYVARLGLVRTKIKHITFHPGKCTSCQICSKNCPIGIEPLSYRQQGKVINADCLKCQVCVEKCPKKSLYVA